MGSERFTNPSKIYDDGTCIRYHQEFLWNQAHLNELHSVTGSNGKYQHEFSRNVDEWDAMNSLCEPYAWWTNLPETGYIHIMKKGITGGVILTMMRKQRSLHTVQRDPMVLLVDPGPLEIYVENPDAKIFVTVDYIYPNYDISK